MRVPCLPPRVGEARGCSKGRIRGHSLSQARYLSNYHSKPAARLALTWGQLPEPERCRVLRLRPDSFTSLPLPSLTFFFSFGVAKPGSKPQVRMAPTPAHPLTLTRIELHVRWHMISTPAHARHVRAAHTLAHDKRNR